MMKKYYWLAAVELTFLDGNGNSAITRVNATVGSESPNVTMTELGKVQQGAQLSLFNKLNEQVRILDLTVLNISALGHMTEDEFTAGAITQSPKAANNG